MEFVGWLLLGAGIYLMYCAYLGVSPLAELKSVLTNAPRPPRYSLSGAVVSHG